MALIKHPWTLLDIAAGNRGSTPLASSLRPGDAGATAGTPAKKAASSKTAFRLFGRRLSAIVRRQSNGGGLFLLPGPKTAKSDETCCDCSLIGPHPFCHFRQFASPPGLKIAWKSTTLAKILPQPDSRHGSLRMSLVFVQSKRALNSSAT
jgi:hypothetical protein